MHTSLATQSWCTWCTLMLPPWVLHMRVYDQHQAIAVCKLTPLLPRCCAAPGQGPVRPG